MKCILLNCWDQISQDTINAAIYQVLKILSVAIGALWKGNWVAGTREKGKRNEKVKNPGVNITDVQTVQCKNLTKVYRSNTVPTLV